MHWDNVYLFYSLKVKLNATSLTNGSFLQLLANCYRPAKNKTIGLILLTKMKLRYKILITLLISSLNLNFLLFAASLIISGDKDLWLNICSD